MKQVHKEFINQKNQLDFLFSSGENELLAYNDCKVSYFKMILVEMGIHINFF